MQLDKTKFDDVSIREICEDGYLVQFIMDLSFDDFDFISDEFDRVLEDRASTFVFQNCGSSVFAWDKKMNDVCFTFRCKMLSKFIGKNNIAIGSIKDFEYDDDSDPIVTILIHCENAHKSVIKKSNQQNKSKIIKINSDDSSLLIFDIETSGLDPRKSVILQLSYEIINLSSWETIKQINHYFPWPNNQNLVDEEAIVVNGLTKEFLNNQQLSSLEIAIKSFFEDLHECDIVCAHNFEFDRSFIDSVTRSLDIEEKWPTCIDTMIDTVKLCKVGPKKNGEYKYPKLLELANYLGINTSASIHNSISDVIITKKCFKQLIDIGFYQIERSNPSLNLQFNIFGELDDFIQNSTSPTSFMKFYCNKDSIIDSNKSLLLPFISNKQIKSSYDTLLRLPKKIVIPVIEQRDGYEYYFFFCCLSDMIDYVDKIIIPNFDHIDYGCINTIRELLSYNAFVPETIQKTLSCINKVFNEYFPLFIGEPGELSNLSGLYSAAKALSLLYLCLNKIRIQAISIKVNPDYSKILLLISKIPENMINEIKYYTYTAVTTIQNVMLGNEDRTDICFHLNLTVDSKITNACAKEIQSLLDRER